MSGMAIVVLVRSRVHIPLRMVWMFSMLYGIVVSLVHMLMLCMERMIMCCLHTRSSFSFG